MKAIVLGGIRKFEMHDVPDPVFRTGRDVLVRMQAVGVCGSDIHYYTTGRIGSQVVKFPFVIGHEGAGIVERVGSEVTRVRPGDRIAVEPALSCGRCDQCTSGHENTCRELLFLGNPGQLDGCMSELLVVHESQCFPVGPGVSFDRAAFAEPLAIGMYAVERAAPARGAAAAILGAGPIGMSVFHALRARGIGPVFVTDRVDARLGYARRLGPAWAGKPETGEVVDAIRSVAPSMADVVFECTGDPEAIAQSLSLLRPAGRLVIVGIPDVDEISLPIHELRRNEIDILNIRRQAHCTQKAIDLISSNLIDMSGLVTHHFPLAATADAFDLVSQYGDGVMKAIITF
jgi:L-iditol 2-dehydrogenase